MTFKSILFGCSAAFLAALMPLLGAARAETAEGTKLADGMGYVSLVRLEHQEVKAKNGLVMIAFELPRLDGIPLYQSSDDGTSWTYVTLVKDGEFTGRAGCRLRWQPNLIELPRDSGPLKRGTLLLSANTTCDDSEHRLAEEHLQVYVSTDLGHSWSYRGTIVDGMGNPEEKDNHGVWEPNLVILPDGRMVAYYSSEDHKKDGFNQLLAHKVSTDGGVTWSEEVYDSAVPGGVERPGMAAVISLPDGRYAYTYEDIDGPRNNGQVHTKFSRDGLDWGAPADRGWPIATMGGAWPAACPQINWFPIGGPNGVLVVSAERAGGSGDPGGRSLYWNNDLGRGPWWEIRAPVQKATGNIAAGWTQALMLKRDGRLLHITSSSTSAHPENADGNEILYAAAPLSFSRYEAEDAARSGSAAYIRDDRMSNRGRVRLASGEMGRLDFDIYVPQAGTYPVSVRYTPATLSPAEPNLSVNGARIAPLVEQPSGDWLLMTGRIKLTAGSNRISITGGKNSADVDYLELGTPAPQRKR